MIKFLITADNRTDLLEIEKWFKRMFECQINRTADVLEVDMPYARFELAKKDMNNAMFLFDRMKNK